MEQPELKDEKKKPSPQVESARYSENPSKSFFPNVVGDNKSNSSRDDVFRSTEGGIKNDMLDW